MENLFALMAVALIPFSVYGWIMMWDIIKELKPNNAKD